MAWPRRIADGLVMLSCLAFAAPASEARIEPRAIVGPTFDIAGEPVALPADRHRTADRASRWG